jgi:hypothetical protein
MQGSKPPARRWTTIHVVGFGTRDVETIALDGQGGIASGLTRPRQHNRRLDLSRIAEQLSRDRPAWRFAKADDRSQHELPVPEIAFDDFPEPVTTFDFGDGDSTWADLWL